MLSMIVAVANNNIIGGENKLLWHIPEDLKRFKKITSGHSIIMGRKTFESLPGILPNRKHIIITKNKNFKIDSEMVEVIHNIDDIINRFTDSSEEMFIIGGGEIYKALLPFTNKIYLTKVLHNFEGDTYFPEFLGFKILETSDVLTSEKTSLNYQFINLIKE